MVCLGAGDGRNAAALPHVDRVAMDYGRVRRGQLLAPLEVVAVPAGTYERERRKRLSDGSAKAQLKVNVLYPSVAAVEALLFGS